VPSLRQLAWPLLIAALASVLYIAIETKRETLVDFEVYRTAAVRALAAEPLYRPEDGHFQYKYLPVFALAMAPFALAPHAIATGAWFALSVVLLCLFMRQSARLLPNRRLSERALLWLVAIFTGKFWVKELMLGQTNILLGVLLICALAAAQRDRWRPAAVLVGLGTLVKPYGILLVPWLAIVGGPPAILVSSTVLLLGLVVPAVVYGWQGNVALLFDWHQTVTETTAPNLLYPENISLAAMWAKWLGPGAAAWVLVLVTGVGALALVATVLVMRRRVSEPNYLGFGLLMIFVPLLSPQGWDYVLLIAAPALFCLLDRWREVWVPWKIGSAVGIALVSFTIFDLLGRGLYTRLMAMSVVSIGALLLVFCLAHLRWRSLA
jgi:hypothetical protein